MAKQSAGVLLWRRRDGRVEVLLAHPGGPLFAHRDNWSIPKGEYEPGETALEAAYREFTEETGHAVPAGAAVDLGRAKQRGGKVNTLFAVEGDLDTDACHSNDFTMESHGRTQTYPEMDRFGWYDLASARRKLFASQVVFVDRLAEHLAQPRTAPTTA